MFSIVPEQHLHTSRSYCRVHISHMLCTALSVLTLNCLSYINRYAEPCNQLEQLSCALRVAYSLYLNRLWAQYVSLRSIQIEVTSVVLARVTKSEDGRLKHFRCEDL